MIHDFFYRYETQMVELLGYELAVLTEDIILGLSCFFLGGILMAFLAGAFLLRLHKIEDYGKSKLRIIQVIKGKESKTVLSRRNLWESFQQILVLSFSPFFTLKDFTERDINRTKRFLIIMGIIIVIVLFLALIALGSVLQPI